MPANLPSLLPCPFCGGANVRLSNTHTACFSVECEDCEGSITGQAFHYRGNKDTAKFHYDPEAPAGSPFDAQELRQMPAAYQKAAASAVAAWNRRAYGEACRGGWLPIESAPKSTALLLYCGCHYEIGHFNERLNEWVRGQDHATIKPTHWRPLPEPPTPERTPA